jgi:hypothetical protein
MPSTSLAKPPDATGHEYGASEAIAIGFCQHMRFQRDDEGQGMGCPDVRTVSKGDGSCRWYSWIAVPGIEDAVDCVQPSSTVLYSR